MGKDSEPARRRSDIGPFAMVPLWIAEAVSAPALIVFIYLARHANDDGEAWPSVASLARQPALACSPRTVQRHLAELEEAGAIEIIQRRRPNGSRTSNLYRLRFADPQGDMNVTPPTTPVSPPELEPVEGVVPTPSGEGSGTPPAQRRDLIFEAVAEVLGVPLDKVPKGKNARGKWNAAVRDLKLEEATPDEIVAVAAVYRETWPSTTLTPTALATHFAHLRAAGLAARADADAAARFAAAHRWIEEDGWKLWPDEESLRDHLARGLGPVATGDRLDQLLRFARTVAES